MVRELSLPSIKDMHSSKKRIMKKSHVLLSLAQQEVFIISVVTHIQRTNRMQHYLNEQ